MHFLLTWMTYGQFDYQQIKKYFNSLIRINKRIREVISSTKGAALEMKRGQSHHAVFILLSNRHLRVFHIARFDYKKSGCLRK